MTVQEQSSSCSGGRNLRACFEGRCLAPITLNDDVQICALNHHSYRLLPQPQQLHLNLSVLKLDGSLFDVCVAKNATVAELKQAVEDVFVSCRKEISWSHVWGHFCLSYADQQLINDKALLRNFRIKDGDQLQFIRHLSIQNSPMIKSAKNKSIACKLHSLLSSGSIFHEETEETGSDDIDDDENQEKSSKCHGDDNQEDAPIPELKLANVLRGWLSNSSLWGISRKRSEGWNPSSSRFGQHCLGGGTRVNNDISLKLTRNECKIE
ncbi:hypothetical protein FH972_001955 [Carpinus fangiana]|uniref:SNRNP25 ubiquitin-like domain-containing protein n=1 Tax=Carpinus fangiana TaxID=176857 RepID=A0A5N6QF80_9ROSI|nr:hypothetical protein FH972_001955 [Carpinus fangiana]